MKFRGHVRTALSGSSRAPLALVAALVAAEAAVLLLRPRHGVIEPASVRPDSYFSASELDRARDFRQPQLLLFAGSLVVQLAFLVVLTRRPPRLIRGRHEHRFRAAGGVGAALAVALALVTLPLDAVSRQRAVDIGLVTQSWGGWTVDLLKSLGIDAVLGGVGALVAVALIARYPRNWWLPGALAVVAAGAAFSFAGPVVLDPVFNRFKELPAGETRRDVLDLARRAGVKVDHVYEVDASRRTTAVNAYVTGLGATKRVVLYDNLIRDFSRDETRVVVAHELGHVHHHDVPRGILFLALVAPFAMFAVQALTEALLAWPRRTRIDMPVVPRAGPPVPSPRIVVALTLSLAIVGGGVSVISNALSRRVEARADSFALQKTGAVDAFVAFERRVALRNVIDPDPPGWSQFLLGTHPSTIERIGIARAYETRR
jgi:STE24 endopeptidase